MKIKTIDLGRIRNTMVFGKPSSGKTTSLPLTVNLKSTRKILIMDTKELLTKLSHTMTNKRYTKGNNKDET